MLYVFSLLLSALSIAGVYETYAIKHLSVRQNISDTKKSIVDKYKTTIGIIQLFNLGMNIVYLKVSVRIIQRIYGIWFCGQDCTEAVVAITLSIGILYTLEIITDLIVNKISM